MQSETTSTSALTEQTPVHPPHLTSELFHHKTHPHQPQNVNVLHETELKDEVILEILKRLDAKK